MKAVTRRHWYKPAGSKVNQALDVFEASLATLHRRYQVFVQRELRKKGERISCNKGCTACCRCAFLCTFPEGLLIARHVLAYRSEAEVHNLAVSAGEYRLMQEELGAEGWFELRRDCLFLNANDDTCSVYRLRPFVCRVHMAVSPPELCEAGGGAVIVGSRKVSDIRNQLAEAVTDDLTGQKRLIVATLPGAVELGLQALMHNAWDVKCASLEDSQELYRAKWRPEIVADK